MISASKTARALNCPGSFALPQEEGGESEHAARGTIIHNFMEDVRTHGREVALRRVEAIDGGQHAKACEAIDTDWLLGLGGKVLVEAGFSFNPADGTAHYHGEHKKHGDIDGLVTGIADLVVITDTAVVILDYKTGRMVERAQDNPQLLTLGVMVELAFGLDLPVDGAIVYLWDDIAHFDRASWDVMDLDAHRSALVQAYVTIQRREGGIQPGRWCRYCPAYGSCPVKTGMMRAAAEGRLRAAIGEALAQGQAAAAVQTLADLKGLVGFLHNQLQEYAKARGPIDLGGGKEWGPRESVRESLDGKVVYEMLRSSFSPEVALSAVTLEATKGGLEDALRPLAKAKGRGALKEMKEAAMQFLRTHGGVTTKTITTFDEHPKKS